MSRKNKIIGVKSKKVLQLALAVLTLASMLLLLNESCNADALNTEELVEAAYEGALIGEDNMHYTVQENGSILYYDTAGVTYTRELGGAPEYIGKYLRLINIDTGEEAAGYSIEFASKKLSDADDMGTDNIGSPDTDNAGRTDTDDASYLNNLPGDIKQMITATVYYGSNGINKIPVSGANDDDFYFATQIIIWEIQQQIRVLDRNETGSIAGTKTVSAHGMEEEYFHNMVKGRPAEKCYDYLVGQIEKYFTIPDFISETAAEAKLIKLKYSMLTGNWHDDIKDSSGSSLEFTWDDTIVRLQKNKDKYLFFAAGMIEGVRTVRIKRKAAVEAEYGNRLLIRSCDYYGSQRLMLTNFAAAAEFYVKLAADVPAQVTIQSQDAESGEAISSEGAEYKIKSLDLDIYVSAGMKNPAGDIYRTGAGGKVNVEERLQAGKFRLEEVKAPRGYTAAEKSTVFYVDGDKARITVTHDSTPQKGVITIESIDKYSDAKQWESIRKKAQNGLAFDIMALADITGPDGTVRVKKGEVVSTVNTDFSSDVSTEALYIGPYNVVEKDTPVEHRISNPINIALEYEEPSVSVAEKKINILDSFKHSTDSFGKTPRTGNHREVDTALMTLLASLILIGIMSIIFALRRED